MLKSRQPRVKQLPLLSPLRTKLVRLSVGCPMMTSSRNTEYPASWFRLELTHPLAMRETQFEHQRTGLCRKEHLVPEDN